MNMKRFSMTMGLMAVIVGMSVGMVSASGIPVKNPPTPNYLPAVVDGNSNEWMKTPLGGTASAGVTTDSNIVADNPDWFSNLCNESQGCDGSTHGPFGDLFLRYQCTDATQGTLYALFLARSVSGYVYYGDGTGGSAFIKVAGNKVVDDGSTYTSSTTPPMWRNNNPTGAEAAISLAPGTYSIQFHTNMPPSSNPRGTGYTAGTGSISVTVACPPNTPTSPYLNSHHVDVSNGIAYDIVIIAGTATTPPTGTVTWYYCYSSTIPIPFVPSTIPGWTNGCTPTSPGFNPTSIGSTSVTALLGPGNWLAFNALPGRSIPSQLGPQPLAVTGATFQEKSYTGPTLTTSSAGTYCFYATYTPDANASSGGWTSASHSNATTQCFIRTAPTAVNVSSFTAQTVNVNGFLNTFVVLGLVLVGMISVAGLSVWRLLLR